MTNLADIHALADFEPVARLAMEPAAYDYVAGGAWDEITLAENVAAWRRRRLRPRVLVDVHDIDPATTMLDVPVAFPAAIAPTASHALAHPDAEIATARAAAAAGIPFILSTMSTCSMEEVAAAAPDGTRWFQLYVQADPPRTRELVDRAAAAGYSAIVLTVDLPRLGYRQRDRQSGFVLSGRLGNFAEGQTATHAQGVHADTWDVLEDRLDTGLSWESVATIRGWTDLPLVLKGIMTGEDGAIAADHGVEAIVVSNHGARQLDRVAAPVDVLEEVAAAVDGRTEIWVDGAVRRGLDIAIARALGARGVLLGKPILWSLAAGGEAGVARALAILREEFEITLSLLGAPTPDQLVGRHLVAVPR